MTMIQRLSLVRRCIGCRSPTGFALLTKRHWSASSQSNGAVLGIQRESYDVWERRTPLCPNHVATLLGNPSVGDVLVQPSSSRIYSDIEYELAGATVQENLASADLILGVKRPLSIDSLYPNKSYMFFSHVIKGQPENMPLLQHVLDNHIELFDYECIVEGCKEKRPKRLVAFGKFAGRAGMTDALNPLGRRLLALGFSTPFLHCPPAHMQKDWTAVQETVKKCGDCIAIEGLSATMEPIVFCMTGKGGNVYSGVMKVFDLLPHKIVSVDELPNVVQQTGPQHCVYGVSVGPEHIFQQRGSDAPFDRDHYLTNPQEYESTFHQRIAPYINVLVNGMYWDDRYPRLLTKDQMKQLYVDGNKRYVIVVLAPRQLRPSLFTFLCFETGSCWWWISAAMCMDPLNFWSVLQTLIDLTFDTIPLSSRRYRNPFVAMESLSWESTSYQPNSLARVAPTLEMLYYQYSKSLST